MLNLGLGLTLPQIQSPIQQVKLLLKKLLKTMAGYVHQTQINKNAKNVMSSLLKCQRALDKALETAEKIEVDNEKEAIKGVIKNVIGDILTDAIMPIISQHPDLNPYK